MDQWEIHQKCFTLPIKMLENIRFYIIYLALLSGTIGLFSIRKLPNNKAKSILIIIWLAFLVEFIGINFSKWTGKINYLIFNGYIFISFFYYLLLLKTLLVKKNNQKVGFSAIILFTVFYLINFFLFQHDIDKTFTNSFTIGVFLILVLSCLYLIEIFNTEKVLNFKKSIYFWFILGILLFHVPFLPFMLAIDWFLIERVESIYSFVLFFLNLLMHSCFIIGFIWTEKKYNY